MDIKDALNLSAHLLKHAGTEHATKPRKLPIHAGKAEITEKSCRKQQKTAEPLNPSKLSVSKGMLMFTIAYFAAYWQSGSL